MLLIKKATLGLALSGGGIRGFAHLGVLKVLEEHNIKVDFLAGTSIGAILGALYAQGIPVKDIIAITIRIKWSNIIQLPLNISGISSGEAIEKLLKKYIPHDSFSKLKIPFSVLVSDLSHGQKLVMNSGNLSLAIRISASFPGIYTPVIKDEKILCDGGIFCNLPVDITKKMGAKIVVGVDVLPECNMTIKDHNMLNIMDRSIDLLLKQQPIKHCDLLLKPVTKDIGSLDIARKFELIDMGEKVARSKLLPFLKKHGLFPTV